jgi:aspartate kinase
VKVGGSVLTGREAYHEIAGVLAAHRRERSGAIVAVVSAARGVTDALSDDATHLAGGSGVDPAALDLLWSTGELQSVARLTLALAAQGVAATPLAVHEVGLRRRAAAAGGAASARIVCNPLAVLTALARAPVVVAPGFLALEGGRVVTIGRGGSDWSAVQLAIGLGAARCDLIKDVDGFFTADPHVDAAARLMPHLSHDEAIAMAAAGCPLVQRQALEAARDAGLDLVIRSIRSSGTHVGGTHGLRH